MSEWIGIERRFEHLTRVRPWLKPVPMIASSTRPEVVTAPKGTDRNGDWPPATQKLVAAHMVGAEKGAR